MCPSLPTTLNSGATKKKEWGRTESRASFHCCFDERKRQKVNTLSAHPPQRLRLFSPLSPWVLVKLGQRSKCLIGWPLVRNEVLTNTDEDCDTGTHHATYDLLLIQQQLSISAKSILLFLFSWLLPFRQTQEIPRHVDSSGKRFLLRGRVDCWRLEATAPPWPRRT